MSDVSITLIITGYRFTVVSFICTRKQGDTNKKERRAAQTEDEHKKKGRSTCGGAIALQTPFLPQKSPLCSKSILQFCFWKWNAKLSRILPSVPCFTEQILHRQPKSPQSTTHDRISGKFDVTCWCVLFDRHGVDGSIPSISFASNSTYSPSSRSWTRFAVRTVAKGGNFKSFRSTPQSRTWLLGRTFSRVKMLVGIPTWSHTCPLAL